MAKHRKAGSLPTVERQMEELPRTKIFSRRKNKNRRLSEISGRLESPAIEIRNNTSTATISATTVGLIPRLAIY